MSRRRIIYIGILLIVTVIVSITTFSYAFLTKVDEQHGKLNMVVGDLTYSIESSDLNNNSITLSAGEGKEIEIIIKAENEIDSKYELYTNNVENVEIGYLDEEGFEEPTGTIGKTGTKKIKVVLENTSDTSKTITFGVQGGFDYNNITLASGRVAVELGQPICNIAPGTSFEFSYTGSVQEFKTRCNGIYKIEVWGAQGGNAANDVQEGKGGYSKGEITLSPNTKLYVYVGEQGQSVYARGAYAPQTFNGGGNSYCPDVDYWEYYKGASGGGATDIRLTSGSWDNFDSLKSRIIVAAGGGGSFSYNTSQFGGNGGNAGGLNGYRSGNGNQINGDTTYYPGAGGTQTSSGGVTTGGLGYGANGTTVTGGGGAGYYGGGTSTHVGAGGGGSSFISGYNGCNAIDETSTSENIIHTNQANHYSGKVFTNGVMIDGAGCNWSTGSATNCGANQPQPNGTNATGHSGNGYARITYIGD